MAEFRLETPRLVLREWRAEDREAFEKVLNTEAATRMLGGPLAPEGVDALFDRRRNDHRRVGLSYWAAELKHGGELIGSCGLRLADDYAGTPVHKMTEIGWRLGEAYWGQGYAIEAAHAALGWAWGTTDADGVAAWTTPANLPSQRVMQRLGMMRRPDLDFESPRLPPGHPLRPHITYRIERPA